MASRVLVSGLPGLSLPFLRALALPVSPVSRAQRAAPHSSQFPPTEAPLQTLHMDVWGPARVRGQGQERYFLLVVDDYSRYTTVSPCAARTFTLPDSPQQNGIAERRIGMVMDVARTSMMHAALPIFCGRLRSGTLRTRSTSTPGSLDRRPPQPCCGRGRLAMRRRSGSGDLGAFVRDLSADKLSPRCFSLRLPGVPPDWVGFSHDPDPWCVHPTSRRVLSSQDVTFDESVPYYRLFPYRTPSLPPPPLFLVPGPPPVVPLPPQGPPLQSGGAAEPGGAEPGGAEPGGAEPGVLAWGCCVLGCSEPGATLPQELREWFATLEVCCWCCGFFGLQRVLLPRVPPVLVLWVLELLGLRVLLELVLLRVLALSLPLAVRLTVLLVLLLEVLELLVVLLEVLLEWVLLPGLLVLFPAVSGVAARPRPYFVPLLQQVLGLPPPPPPP
ncbi:unnamed protein product [Closterium sp. NIES-64]|nr:unnamed protein product [Closterium sp. NIES-64]